MSGHEILSTGSITGEEGVQDTHLKTYCVCKTQYRRPFIP